MANPKARRELGGATAVQNGPGLADGEVLRTVKASEIDEAGVLDLVMKGSAA